MAKRYKKRRAKRILGNDRGLMMLSRDVRRRWMQYGENRKIDRHECASCGDLTHWEVLDLDHIKPMGPRPRAPEEFGDYIHRMFNNKCQALCKSCHKIKTDAERKRRKK